MHLVENKGRVKYLYCDVCGKRPWKHHDWEIRCDCDPEDDDPTPAEIFLRAREARKMTREGKMPKQERNALRTGRTKVIERSVPVNEYEHEQNAKNRMQYYRDDIH